MSGCIVVAIDEVVSDYLGHIGHDARLPIVPADSIGSRRYYCNY